MLLALFLLPVPVLEARAAGGRLLLSRPAFPGYRFELQFQHSAFDIPVRELFTVDWAGRMVLGEVRSTRADIVDYYLIPGAQVVDRPGDVRIVGLNLYHRHLAIRAARIGRRSFADGECHVQFSQAAGDGNRLTLAVAYRPWPSALLDGRRSRCRNPMP